MKWVGYLALGLIVVLAAGFAWVSRAPYDVPEAAYVETKTELAPSSLRRAPKSRVVLLVFDGLAPATLAAAHTPNLDRMARTGAHSRDMLPVFPSLSMPNHTSLSTGCQPARHGVVANHFMDPKHGINVRRGDADWLLQCEPLHVVAERQGIRSAVLGWVANSSSTRGKLATVAETYRPPVPSAQHRVDQVLELLDDDRSFGYIAAYSDEPDHTAHVHGPTGAQTVATLEEIDAQVGRMMTAIEASAQANPDALPITLIVTTDHGMAEVKGMLNVDAIVRRAGVDGLVVAEGTIAFVHLDDPSEREVAIEALSRGAHYDVIDPQAPPPYVQIGTSPRVGDVVLAAHEGYWMADLGRWPWHLRWSSYFAGDVIDSGRFKGMHGYDPLRVRDVRAVFLAWGQMVTTGLQLKGMRSVDVHPTVTALLGISPGSPMDGTPRRDVLRAAPPDAGIQP